MNDTDEYTFALASGARVAEYRIDRMLGEGGFGLTYLAFDEELHKKVALKEYLPADFAVRGSGDTVMPRTQATRNEFDWGLDAFVNEARTLARFQNPNIVQVYRFLKANGTAYIVMEFVEGRTLSDAVKELGRLTESEVRSILMPVMDGLLDVHEAGILHRDIKPDNILIRDNGLPVLIDFGAARQALANKSRSITTILTPGYAPLEQYSSKGNVGEWSDIYALAATAYFCLTQQRPEEASERSQEDQLPPLVEVAKEQGGSGFLAALDHGLALKPKQRPQTLHEFVAELNIQKVTPTPTPGPAGGSETILVKPPVGVINDPPTPTLDSTEAAANGVDSNANRTALMILLGLLLLALLATLAVQQFMGGDDGQVTSSQEATPSERPTSSSGSSAQTDRSAHSETNDRPAPTPSSEPAVAEASPAEPSTQYFLLTVAATPTNARVELLGHAEAYRAGMRLAEGQYQVQVSLSGYRSQQFVVQSVDTPVYKQVTLQRDISAEEQRLFERAQTSRSLTDLQTYLQQYPNGTYRDQVQQWLREAEALAARQQQQQQQQQQEQQEQQRREAERQRQVEAERQRQIAEQEAQAQREQANQRAWQSCSTLPGKAAGLTGRAYFQIPNTQLGQFSIKIGRFTVQPNAIQRVYRSDPYYGLCGGASCYEVRGNFGSQAFSLSRQGHTSRGQTCFYYLDEKPHVYRLSN